MDRRQPEPERECWLHPDVQIGSSPIAQFGLFARAEVTIDYATSTGVAGFAMACACGSSLCRGVIAGEDWRRPELQARYGDHWIPVLLARIRQAGLA